MKKLSFLFIALTLALAGCGPKVKDRTVAYKCDNGMAMTAYFTSAPNQVRMQFDEKHRLVLNAADEQPEKGFLYKSPTNQFSGDDHQAAWTQAQNAPVTCKADK